MKEKENRKDKRERMISTIKAEKAFDQIHWRFMIKASSKLKVEGSFLKLLSVPVTEIMQKGEGVLSHLDWEP